LQNAEKKLLALLSQVPRRVRVQISRKRNDDEDATVRAVLFFGSSVTVCA
jgi:hypothetical protein